MDKAEIDYYWSIEVWAFAQDFRAIALLPGLNFLLKPKIKQKVDSRLVRIQIFKVCKVDMLMITNGVYLEKESYADIQLLNFLRHVLVFGS